MTKYPFELGRCTFCLLKNVVYPANDCTDSARICEPCSGNIQEEFAVAERDGALGALNRALEALDETGDLPS